MSYKEKTAAFEGPFDLLFHLIKKAEINIYEVSISEIAVQYLAYLKELHELNSEVAGDFLVMAAAMLKLKSQKLLPSNFTANDEEEETEEVLYASEEEFFKRMMEYKQFKSTAEVLKKLEEEEQNYFSRFLKDQKNEITNKDFEELLGKVSLQDLINAMETIMAEIEKQQPEVILPEEISLTDKMNEITSLLLNSGGRAELKDLFKKQSSRSAVIVTFLALLVLIKGRKLSVKQKYTFGPIEIYYIFELEECEKRWKVNG
ncbi:MAG: hypothetical protein CVU88_00555 [Firmicutes bacterium HGW-Firmicutes-13]|nr:MAG: hypothetical protein CVU88_00555 [Firmicutes bacterium HGW-Firmicutes-13]